MNNLLEIKSPIDGGRLTAYVFLLQAEKSALIDTGGNITPGQDIIPALSESGLMPSEIKYILNTHGHYDHTGGNAEMKRLTNAQIAIHTDDEILIADQGRFYDEWFRPVINAIGGPELVKEEWDKFVMLAGEKSTADLFVKDNDLIDLGKGIVLRVIHLPGHTFGSIGYYWEKEGVLFAGDALPGLFLEDGSLPIIIDIEEYKSSVRKLMDMPINAIYQSHDHRGIVSTPAYKIKGKAVSQYLNDCMESAESIEQAIMDTIPFLSGKSMFQIYNEVVRRVPSKMSFKPKVEEPVPAFSSFVIYFTLLKHNLLI